MRVGTWNLEWAERSRLDRLRQAEELAGARADVWVLTEARPDVLPEGWQSTASANIPPTEGIGAGHRDWGCFAVVGAPELQSLAVPELPTGACALVSIDGEDWLVLGVCMPWRMGVPPLPPNAAPGAQDGPARWRAVLDRVDAVLFRLTPRLTPNRVLLAGDLNQTLAGPNVGFNGGRQAVDELLSRHDLVAYTRDAPSLLAGCSSVDHVCGPRRHAQVNSRPDMSLSDHRACVVDLR